LLLVVAHPDDETFGCGSVIADAAAGGAHVTVCCATRGEAGECVPGFDLAGRSLADVRVDELRTAGAALGAADVVVLDFGDSGMDGPVAAHTLVGAPLETVVTAVADVVARVDPDVVVTLDPTGGDGHRDHARIAEATTEAVPRWDGGSSLYHWGIPRSLLVRWLEGQREAHPDRGHLALDEAPIGRPDADFTTRLDVRAHLEARRAAFVLHASQASPFADMPDDLVDAFLSVDHLVRVDPPWTGGATETALHIPDR
jgi:LmbE family N-acetylglucosaminyl deacetylase